MKNLFKFTAILLIIVVALMLTLVVAGVFDSKEFWDNIATALKLIGIGLGATFAVLLIAKK